MDYSGKIIKAYLRSTICLLSISTVALFFFFLISVDYGVLTGPAENNTVSLQEKREFLKDSVNRIILSIESDLEFCYEFQLEGDEKCDIELISRMAKKRIQSMSLVDGYIQVNNVNEPIGPDLAALHFMNISLPKDKSPQIVRAAFASDTSPESTESSQDFLKEGEVFVKFDIRDDTSGRIEHKLSYLKYYERFDWIISADVKLERHSSVMAAVLSDGNMFQKGKFVIPVVLIIIGFFSAYFYYGRIQKELSSQENQRKIDCNLQEQKEEELLKDLSDKEEERLKQQNTLSQFIKAADNVAVIITDADASDPLIKDISPGLEYLLGCGSCELVAKNFSKVLAPEFAREHLNLIEKVINVKKSFSGEGFFQNSEEKIIPVEFSTHPLISNDGKVEGTITLAVDCSKLNETRKSLQLSDQRLLHAQKMEAIGTLAGGIAHDFNNVLSSIVGYSELLKDELPIGSQQRQDLDQILNASNRASNLVKQILSYTRKAELGSGYFEPSVIVKETLKMLRPTIPSTIEIRQDIQVGGEVVYANSSQIHQLFMNLCTNAYQSMTSYGSGILEVKLQKTDWQSYFPEEFQSESEFFLELTVADTGCGIDAGVGDRVFEPFFTTRGESGGSGMGLSNVKNIVSLIGGTIWYEGKDSGGTIFHVLFPIKDDVSYRSSVNPSVVSEVKGGKESILYVDDEPDITRMAQAMLGGLGYEVHGCYSGIEAYDLFCEKKDQIDLVITDQTMPGLTGAELTKKIRTISSVPIILSTGYSSKISEDNWSKFGVSGFIMKPYRKVDIARLVREILDKAGGLQ